jgi:hypothetical protein
LGGSRLLEEKGGEGERGIGMGLLGFVVFVIPILCLLEINGMDVFLLFFLAYWLLYTIT